MGVLVFIFRFWFLGTVFDSDDKKRKDVKLLLL
jgi:hypothetical protein